MRPRQMAGCSGDRGLPIWVSTLLWASEGRFPCCLMGRLTEHTKNGVPVAGVDDLHRALTQERAGIEVPLGVLRRTGLLTVPVTPLET